MITEQELRDAIAECQGQRNPNASTCMKLASYLTILDHIEEPVQQHYSYAAGAENTIRLESGTEFAEAVHGRDVDEVMDVMDELMTTLSVVNPRLYNSVMRRLT